MWPRIAARIGSAISSRIKMDLGGPRCGRGCARMLVGDQAVGLLLIADRVFALDNGVHRQVPPTAHADNTAGSPAVAPVQRTVEDAS